MSNARHDRSAKREITTYLMDRYGPLLGREALTAVLGFPSVEAFDRYVQRGHLALKLVRMPNRRGVFALGPDVAAYLTTISRGGEAAKRKEREGER